MRFRREQPPDTRPVTRMQPHPKPSGAEAGLQGPPDPQPHFAREILRGKIPRPREPQGFHGRRVDRSAGDPPRTHDHLQGCDGHINERRLDEPQHHPAKEHQKHRTTCPDTIESIMRYERILKIFFSSRNFAALSSKQRPRRKSTGGQRKRSWARGLRRRLRSCRPGVPPRGPPNESIRRRCPLRRRFHDRWVRGTALLRCEGCGRWACPFRPG